MILSPREDGITVFVQLEFDWLSLLLSEHFVWNQAVEQGVSDVLLTFNVDLIPSQVVEHRLW